MELGPRIQRVILQHLLEQLQIPAVGNDWEFRPITPGILHIGNPHTKTLEISDHVARLQVG